MSGQQKKTKVCIVADQSSTNIRILDLVVHFKRQFKTWTFTPQNAPGFSVSPIVIGRGFRDNSAVRDPTHIEKKECLVAEHLWQPVTVLRRSPFYAAVKMEWKSVEAIRWKNQVKQSSWDRRGVLKADDTPLVLSRVQDNLLNNCQAANTKSAKIY